MKTYTEQLAEFKLNPNFSSKAVHDLLDAYLPGMPENIRCESNACAHVASDIFGLDDVPPWRAGGFASQCAYWAWQRGVRGL
jgi:hypothetical protein